MHYRKLHLCLYTPRGHIARSFSEHGIRSLRGRERIVPSVLQTFSALCACGILGSEVEYGTLDSDPLLDSPVDRRGIRGSGPRLFLLGLPAALLLTVAVRGPHHAALRDAVEPQRSAATRDAMRVAMMPAIPTARHAFFLHVSAAS